MSGSTRSPTGTQPDLACACVRARPARTRTHAQQLQRSTYWFSISRFKAACGRARTPQHRSTATNDRRKK